MLHSRAIKQLFPAARPGKRTRNILHCLLRVKIQCTIWICFFASKDLWYRGGIYRTYVNFIFLREGTLFVVVLFLHEIVPEVETGIQMHFRLKAGKWHGSRLTEMSIWTLLCLVMWHMFRFVDADCISSPCQNNGTCVPASFRCECPLEYSGKFCDIECPPRESTKSYEGFTTGFLSGAGAMLFLFASVCGTVCLTRKYEEHKQLRRLKKRQRTVQILSKDNIW